MHASPASIIMPHRGCRPLDRSTFAHPMLNLIISFITSFLVTLLIVRFVSQHNVAADSDLEGVQKFHSGPVPRIGGLAIVLAFGLTLITLWLRDPKLAQQLALLLACSGVVFGIGLAEDLTKHISPHARLLGSFASALLACLALDAIVVRVDIPLFDTWLQLPLLAIPITIVCVGAMVNAINIIDGFNGLASVVAITMFGSMGYVAFKVQDPFVLGGSLIMIGALTGFFLWNYPLGLIFLGDGGAYVTGFILAELGILLVARNPEVSAWYPALLFIYPVFETMFSIYRKKFLRGMSPSMPDGVHLHMLIYKRVIRWAVGSRNARALTRRNAVTSPYLWTLSLLAVVPATVFWATTLALIGFLAMFVCVYSWLYTAIVRFRTPSWLVIRKPRL